MDQGLLWETVAGMDRGVLERLGYGWREWVDFAVLCLKNLDKFARPIVPAKLVMSLSATLEAADRPMNRHQGSFASQEFSISALFFNNKKVQTDLPLAMLDVFCSIDMMEGTDIDNEEDSLPESTVRHSVALLIKKLFSLPDVRNHTFPLLSQSPLYKTFTTKLMSHLLHFFDDLLLRASNVKECEESLAAKQQQGDTKEDEKLKKFMEGEKRSCGGVWRLVQVMMEVLEILISTEGTREGFWEGRCVSILVQVVRGVREG
ncbi:hypothetical protein HK097_006745, partial [Rhizophlyctis rosea]